MRLLFRTPVKKDFLFIKEKFTRELFLYLAPPWATIDIKKFDGCKTGDEIHVHINQSGLKQEWVSLITDEIQTDDEWCFVDEGKVLPWPMTYWKHRHRVLKMSNGHSEIVDDIHFECSPKWMNYPTYAVVYAVMGIRPSRYKKFFEG